MSILVHKHLNSHTERQGAPKKSKINDIWSSLKPLKRCICQISNQFLNNLFRCSSFFKCTFSPTMTSPAESVLERLKPFNPKKDCQLFRRPLGWEGQGNICRCLRRVITETETRERKNEAERQWDIYGTLFKSRRFCQSCAVAGNHVMCDTCGECCRGDNTDSTPSQEPFVMQSWFVICTVMYRH